MSILLTRKTIPYNVRMAVAEVRKIKPEKE